MFAQPAVYFLSIVIFVTTTQDDFIQQLLNIPKYLQNKHFYKPKLTSTMTNAPQPDEMTVTLAMVDERRVRTGFSNANADACRRRAADPTLVIMVMTEPENFLERNCIRRTWTLARRRSDVQVVFFTGRSRNATTELHVAAEIEVYGDFIRTNDVGRSNDTNKVISMLEWVNLYCPHAQFLVNTCDSAYLNVPRILSYVQLVNSTKCTIHGDIRSVRNWKTFKAFHGAYRDSHNVKKYTREPANIVSRSCFVRLYGASLKETVFEMPSLFVAGLLAWKVGASLNDTYPYGNMTTTHRTIDSSTVGRKVLLESTLPKCQSPKFGRPKCPWIVCSTFGLRIIFTMTTILIIFNADCFFHEYC